ncbi:MAG: glycosyltransferase family 4 protein [Phycisphaerae bacterium]
MKPKVLHLLSQRPLLTGSGVSLDALVRCATEAGWQQAVVVGTPRDDPHPRVGDLPPERVFPLVFGEGDLCFDLPGMSDVMPYASSRFSALDARRLEAYRRAWRDHLSAVLERFRPDVIHSRHVWLLSSLVKDAAPDVPVVTHCHATGLRQMDLCPHLAEEVCRGCARNDRFCVLHRGHAEALVERLGVDRSRIRVVGTGYRDEIFHAGGRGEDGRANLVYVGKYSRAKGLEQLLDAFERLSRRRADLVLHVAGDGAGPEAEALRDRMARLAPRVEMHGQLDQASLADLMRRCAVFVLPSFYEGLPLVVVEAIACGCRVVCTDLPGLREALGPLPDGVVELLSMPRLCGPDVPVEADLPAFVDRLGRRIEAALDRQDASAQSEAMTAFLERFTWRAAFERVQAVWRELL